YGILVVIWTEVGETTSTLSTIVVSWARIGALLSGSSARSIENLTATASNASPLWNLTFGRSSNCQVLSSRFFQEVARRGLRERSIKPSWTCWPTLRPIALRSTFGSIDSTSAVWRIVILPVDAAAGAAAAVVGAAARAVVGAAAGAVVAAGLVG